MPSIIGMLNTKSYNDTDRRPKNWREYILYENPNPPTPLTALLGMAGGGQPTDDPEFYFWTKKLPTQRGAITGVYTNSSLSTAYAPANAGACAAIDTVLYLKGAAEDIKTVKVGNVVIIRDEANLTKNFGVIGRVTSKVVNGASSYFSVQLHQVDTYHSTASYLSGALSGASLIFWVTGSSYAEGTGAPEAVAFEPVKCYNYTQIFKTRTSITRTAKSTRLRTGDIMKQIKNEALEIHQIEMEKSFLFGVRKEETDSEGRPLRHTAGLINYCDKDGNLVVPRIAFNGTWKATDATGGFHWLFGQDQQLEQLFRYGSTKRLMLCGSSVISAINGLAKTHLDVTVSVKETTFGMNYSEIICPFGTILMKQHPLFNYEPTMRKTAILIDADNLVFRPIQDTTFKPNIQGNDVDAQDDMFYTEAGLELHFPDTFRVLYNIG